MSLGIRNRIERAGKDICHPPQPTRSGDTPGNEPSIKKHHGSKSSGSDELIRQ